MTMNALAVKAAAERRARGYGITLDQLEALITAQYRSCAICRQQYSRVAILSRCALVIDHDHKTTRVRGLLCQRCNTTLGGFDDSIRKLSAAIDYLRCPPITALGDYWVARAICEELDDLDQMDEIDSLLAEAATS